MALQFVAMHESASGTKPTLPGHGEVSATRGKVGMTRTGRHFGV